MTMQTRADMLGKHRYPHGTVEVFHYDPRYSIEVLDAEPGFFWRDVDEPELIFGPFESSREAYDNAQGEE